MAAASSAALTPDAISEIYTMAEPETPRTTLSTVGMVCVRQRPSRLLMKLQLKAGEATLETGLAKLKEQGEETVQLLKRLGADRVDIGEPVFADQVGKDPIQQAQAITARALQGRRGRDSSGDNKRDLIAVVTALWDIGSLSAEETLALVDRLRFETAADTGPGEESEELPAWATPEEQVREMMAQLQAPPVADPKPEFLFLGRLTEDQWEKATSDAFAHGRHRAERLARAADKRLGRLASLSFNPAAHSIRTDRMMRRQGCLALLDGCAYDLAEDEIAAQDPRAMEFTVAVNATFHLE